MRATFAVIPEENQVCLQEEELDLGRLGPYDIAVETKVSVVSAGTELAIFTGIAPGVHTPGSWNAYPWRPGYGSIGRILGKGERVEELSVGNRVFCFGKHASLQVLDVSGKSPRLSAFEIEEEWADTAVLVRMALIALNAVQLTEVEPGSTVAVFGLGLVGNLACQLYRLAGAQVIGIDPVPARGDAARRAGIETVLCAPLDSQVAAVQESLGGRGVSIAVDAVGDTRVIKNCVEACCEFGQVVLLGSPRVPNTDDSTPCFRGIHNKWLTLRGALEWRLPPYPVIGARHSIESNLRLLLQLYRKSQLQLAPLITHRIAPNALRETYHGLLDQKDTYLGVIVDWDLAGA